MRKQVFGRKFKRNKNQRKALFNGLISAMVLRDSIETTEEKAKSIKGDLEKLVTKAKKGEVSRRLLQPHLKNFEIDRMINEIGPTFKDRNGGYTRIIKIGRRFSDNASMVIMEWTEKIIKVEKPKVEKKEKKALEKSANKTKSKAVKKTKVNTSKK